MTGTFLQLAEVVLSGFAIPCGIVGCTAKRPTLCTLQVVKHVDNSSMGAATTMPETHRPPPPTVTARPAQSVT